MKDAVKLSQEQQKNAPAAKENKQSPSDKDVNDAVQAQPEQAPAPEAKPFVLFERPQIKPEQVAAVKALGFNIEPLFDALEKMNLYAQTVEERFAATQEGFKQVGVYLEQLKPLSELAEQLKGKQIVKPQGNAAATPAGLNVGDIDIPQLINLITAVVGGGGTPQANPYAQKFMELGMENLSLGNALVKAIILKAAPEIGQELISNAVKPTITATVTAAPK